MQFFKILSVLLIFSCVPEGGNVTFGPSSQGSLRPPGEITSIDITGSQMVINGTSLEGITYVSINDPATGISKAFDVTSSTFSKIISESIDTLSLPMNKALELILSNSFGQTTYPITFTLQNNAVATANIQDNAVTTSKIPNGGVTRSKLNKDPGDSPNDGDVLVWDTGTSQFVFAPFTGGGGGGGVVSVTRGTGIANPGTTITVSGTISVDTGITGNSPNTKIPFFNSSNQLEIGNTAEILFSDPSANFSILNDTGSLVITQGSTATDYFVVNANGLIEIPVDLAVKNQTVCLGNGIGCPPSVGGSITSVTASLPIVATTAGNNVNISANTTSLPANNTNPGNLVQLRAVGSFPGVGTLPPVDGSNLLGVIHDVLPGTAISVSKFLGNATVGVNFGAGNAQRWQPNLDNLGNLNTNDNFVIIGNGTSFEVQGGATLLASIGAQPVNANLTNLGSLSPLLGNLIVGSGASWNTQAIPNCASGNVILGNGSAFSCSNSSSPISGGTFTTFNQPGMVIASPATGTTGELRFRGSNNTNYVGFKAAPGVVSDTIWTLPPTDGTSGFALTTNGAGTLGWTNVGGANDVSNATSTLDNAVARFDGTSGKVIQGSGVIIDDLRNISGVANLSSAGTMANTGNIINSGDLTVDTNTLFVDATNNRVGIGKTNPAQELDVTGNINGTGNLTVDTNTLIVDSANNKVGIGTNTPLDFLNIFHTLNNFGGMTIGNSNSGTNSQSTINLMTLVGSTVSIFNASNKGWNITARGNSYSTASEQNDLLFAFNDLNTWRNIIFLDSAAGNMTLMGALTINSNGSNSSTFPTGRGTSGQGLTTDGAGNLSWSNVGGANDVSNAGASTDNAITRFDGTTGKLVQNSGVIIDDSNNISGAVNLIINGALTINNNGSNSSVFPTTRGTNGQVLITNGSGTLSWTSPGGASGIGDVVGPVSSSDMAITRFSGTTGKIIQNSGVMIDNSNNVSQVANFSSSGNMTVDTNTFFVDATNNKVGIGTTSPLDFLNIFHSTNNFGGVTIGNPGTGTTAQSTINLMTLVGNTTSIFNASNKGWHVTARSNAFASAAEQNDLLFAFNDLNTWRNILYLDSAAGNMTLMGALTINSNGSNSSTFPTGRGTSGQGLTTDGAGNLSWSNVGGANDVSNAGASTDNAIARFDGATGKIIINSGVILDDNNVIVYPNSTGNKISLYGGNVNDTSYGIGISSNQMNFWTPSVASFNFYETGQNNSGVNYVTIDGASINVQNSPIPTLRANGNTDNQQSGTLFLSQGDAYGYKLSYDATNTNDGLFFIERRANTETTRMNILNGGQVQIGSVPTSNNVGVARLILEGPNGNGTGPHQAFYTTADNFPVRQFLNWSHDSIWDCFDCYHDGTAFRNSSNSSAFRWQKSATDLVLSGTNAPTAGGTEALTNFFWVSEWGPATFSRINDDNGSPPYTQTGGTITLNGPRGTQAQWKGINTPGGNNDAASEMWNQNGGWGWQRAWIVQTNSPPSVYFNGSIDVAGINNRSSRILKKNIVPMESGVVEIFKRLKPVKYQLRDRPYLGRTRGEELTDAEKETRNHFGFIVEDILEILPDLVGKEDKQTIMEYNNEGVVDAKEVPVRGYDPSEITALLVKVVQEQQKAIESLASRTNRNLVSNSKNNKMLKNNGEMSDSSLEKIQKMKERIEALERKIVNEPIRIDLPDIQDRLYILRPEQKSAFDPEKENLKKEVVLLREQNQKIQKQLDVINSKLNL